MCINHTSKKPYIITITCTKGGSAKSTNAANIGAFCADHGLKNLLIDRYTTDTKLLLYPAASFSFYHCVMLNHLRFKDWH